ncbi:hypothetical protein IB642_01575 [Allofrancisella guangzhouensis]|uniref:Uncharacterized protein n=1 Tax=Allofrancisella guangzhouensis TaxID=594679 RepID=A0A0A8E3Y1_9GAMM|nr:hypothetical protein [Allofrancisella guangzhouensis]AJC48629.1 hypothetical protein SD28_02670 [Allofrancisella guangzhouensis]MBK2027931.1 hypothetical protein [Allofrancisella guangzhouensis]MBK2043706.1 hypothetical protein [Allofrancisella guangzhouensis]MBK2046237.1 hypothetical protein [Allofrancisella guangzhouensis]
MLSYHSIGTIHEAFKLDLSGQLKKYYYRDDSYFDSSRILKHNIMEPLWNSNCTNFRGFEKDYMRTRFLNTPLPDGNEYFSQISDGALEKALSLWGQWLPRIGSLTDQQNVPASVVMGLFDSGFQLKSAQPYEVSFFNVENKLLTYSTLQRFELWRLDQNWEQLSLLGVCYMVKKFCFLGRDNTQHHYVSNYISAQDSWNLQKAVYYCNSRFKPLLESLLYTRFGMVNPSWENYQSPLSHTLIGNGKRISDTTLNRIHDLMKKDFPNFAPEHIQAIGTRTDVELKGNQIYTASMKRLNYIRRPLGVGLVAF